MDQNHWQIDVLYGSVTNVAPRNGNLRSGLRRLRLPSLPRFEVVSQINQWRDAEEKNHLAPALQKNLLTWDSGSKRNCNDHMGRPKVFGTSGKPRLKSDL